MAIENDFIDFIEFIYEIESRYGSMVGGEGYRFAGIDHNNNFQFSPYGGGELEVTSDLRFFFCSREEFTSMLRELHQEEVKELDALRVLDNKYGLSSNLKERMNNLQKRFES